MKELFTYKRRSCFLLLSSLLLCLSCSEEIIEGGTMASKSNESANDMIATEEMARENYYADANTAGASIEAPQTRASAASDLFLMSWMGKLDDNVLLTNLTIPGTHDSAADTGGPFAQCQGLSIQRQLEIGVRAFDIRCRHIADAFAMHHGVIYLNKWFGRDVRNVFINFLREHPTETIIMMAKEEHTATDNTRSFEATMANYIKGCEEFFLLDERDGLTLGDARRKIVLLRRFGSAIRPLGHKINVGDNTYSESNTTIRASIQDYYAVSGPQINYKWGHITRQIQRAAGFNGFSFNPQTLYINFLSASSFPDSPSNLATGGGVRWGINKCLNTDMDIPTYAKGRLGLMYLDFAGVCEPEVISKLINSNMGKGLEPYKTGHYASSEEQIATGGSNGAAIHAFDNNENTYWMSQWTVYKRTFPHSLTMDLGSLTSVSALTFRNRLDAMSGRPSTYTVEYSKDGRTWVPVRISAHDQILNAAVGGSIASIGAAAISAAAQRNTYLPMGTLNTNLTSQKVGIDRVSSARFVRVTFLSARDNTYYVHLAELYPF